MTLIELFPWLLALCVTLLSAMLLQRIGLSNTWALSIGFGFGIISWLTLIVGGKQLGHWLERKKIESGKLERERRVYQAFDSSKQYLANKDLFYECLICENAIPSLTKKTINCVCRNIIINSSRVEIRDRTKVKMFSHTAT
jgi:hypothetical protein